LARIPNPILRGELTDHLAARLLLDDKLLREELRRAAMGRRSEVKHESKLSASPAERQLVRAFLENSDLIDELLPGLVSEGALDGLPTKDIFGKLLELRRAGQSVEIHELTESLSPEEQQLVRETLLAAGNPATREDALKCCSALWRKKIQRDVTELIPAIDAAGKEQNWARLAELQKSKVLLLKELSKFSEN
jgi:hypothetical protein